MRITYDEQTRLEVVGDTAVLVGLPWFVKTLSGQTRSGRLDQSGELPRIVTASEEEYEVFWGEDALLLMEGHWDGHHAQATSEGAHQRHAPIHLRHSGHPHQIRRPLGRLSKGARPIPRRQGKVPAGFDNQCAIRVSSALHHVGVTMKSFNGATVPLHGQRAAMRAEEFTAWLKLQPFCGLPSKPQSITGAD